MLTQVHSLSARLDSASCAEAVPCRSAPYLRPYVAGYAGFRAGAVAPFVRRLLPLNFTTLIVDFAGPSRLATGPRATPLLYGEPAWRHGVSIGLTPAGVHALLDAPAAAMVGEVVPLDAVLGRDGDRLADRLGELPDWRSRFAALDAWFTGRLNVDGERTIVDRAWWRLQQGDRLTIGGLANELGVSQRYLQIGFKKRIGLPPKTVARIARFQRSLGALAAPSATVAAVAASAYTDQSHFHRETRALAGVTPAELFAFVQDALSRRD
ncbi:helix-turn-helix domain-containing protein [Phytohabitans aurantiacus]|uniref:Transcriptional regulator n=1 Tax=Phytohabitans aurantiacus TaxID=3016789 RepID=A0ABQ5QYH8_9ACTN|nr:helix-turn-helix domain-containing protein [Phytohabitans aurantiacus]GLH98744.1 transcriptional regulator [Phytohabitans aurantiacus]